MIKIQESIPRKLSGKTSFFVTFNYKPEIVEALKEFQPAVYHKKDQVWEIGATELSGMLDSLVYLDDIDLTLLPDEGLGIGQHELTQQEIDSFKIKPFKHQIEAINYGLRNPTGKWLLLDGMGLGKTAESMYLAETLHNRHLLEHCLVICGVDNLRQQWKSEIQRFSNLSAVILGEYKTKSGKSRYRTIAERCKQLQEPIDEFFIIVNAATVGYDQFVDAFKKTKNKIGMVILDEAHRFATKSSNRGSNLLKLDTPYELALSGTLVTNSPISCYVPLSWTGNDHATLTNYKGQYCNFGGFNDAQIIGYKNLKLLREEIDGCSLRRTFDQVRGDMPSKTIDYEIVEMSDEQEKFYDNVKNGVKEEVDKVDLKTGNLLALTTRLRQATSAPSVLTSETIDSSKVVRAVQLAEDLLESGEKVIIFSTFIEPTTVLADRLSRYNPLLATGSVDDDLVQRNIKEFRESPDKNLLICTMSKAGTGYSMPECHYAIFIDTPYTYALFSQAVDRIYRITSDQPIFVKVLITKDTIDERVREIIERKKDLQDFLIDGKPSQELISELRDIILNL